MIHVILGMQIAPLIVAAIALCDQTFNERLATDLLQRRHRLCLWISSRPIRHSHYHARHAAHVRRERYRINRHRFCECV